MPRDGSATRDRILAAAQRLVIDNGYAATSVDHVIAASKSSKGAFFHHFESKRALADALVDRYVASDIAFLEDALAATREHQDAAERAIAFIRYFEEVAGDLMLAQSGCLYTSILTETELVSSGASGPITKAVEIWREGYAALLREALGDRTDVDADDVADHVWVTFEGAYLLARTTGDPDHMRRQLRTLRLLIEALLRPPRRGEPGQRSRVLLAPPR